MSVLTDKCDWKKFNMEYLKTSEKLMDYLVLWVCKKCLILPCSPALHEYAGNWSATVCCLTWITKKIYLSQKMSKNSLWWQTRPAILQISFEQKAEKSFLPISCLSQQKSWNIRCCLLSPNIVSARLLMQVQWLPAHSLVYPALQHMVCQKPLIRVTFFNFSYILNYLIFSLFT